MADKENKPVTRYENGAFKGLKIVVKGEVRGVDAQGNPFKKLGKYAKFNEGVLRTDDPETIAAVDAYAAKHQGEIVKIDEVLEKKKASAIKTALDGIENEEKGKQGV